MLVRRARRHFANREDATVLKFPFLLGASPAKVKKVIASLGIEPAAKKGVCSYFDAAAVKKIADALK